MRIQYSQCMGSERCQESPTLCELRFFIHATTLNWIQSLHLSLSKGRICILENLIFRSRSYAKNEEYRLSYWHIKILLEATTDTYRFMKKLHKCWTSKNAILFLILLEFLFFYLQHRELPPKKHLRALLLIFQFLKFFPEEKNRPGIPYSSDG